MTDTERLNFIEKTGVNVRSGTDDCLVPDTFGVCVTRVTGWIYRPTLREALDAVIKEIQTTHPKIMQ